MGRNYLLGRNDIADEAGLSKQESRKKKSGIQETKGRTSSCRRVFSLVLQSRQTERLPCNDDGRKDGIRNAAPQPRGEAGLSKVVPISTSQRVLVAVHIRHLSFAGNTAFLGSCFPWKFVLFPGFLIQTLIE